MSNIFRKLWNCSPASLYSIFKSKINFEKSKKEVEQTFYEIKKGYGKGLNLLLFPDQYNEMVNGTYEAFLIDSIKEEIDLKDKIMLDIGGHFGYVAFCLSRLINENGRIFSFEPLPNNIATYKKNLEENKALIMNIELIEKGVSDIEGTVLFNSSTSINDPTCMGGHMVDTKSSLKENVYEDLNFKKIEIHTITIDKFVKERNIKPEIIKIDTEGAELKVLLGGKEYIKIHKPLLLIEIHNVVNMFYVYRFLNELMYDVRIINEESAEPYNCYVLAKNRNENN
jgi:FkbM family methyltransferase